MNKKENSNIILKPTELKSIRTLTALNNVRSYMRSYSDFMVPKSISDRLTIIRMRVLSSVPSPSIALCSSLERNEKNEFLSTKQRKR